MKKSNYSDGVSKSSGMSKAQALYLLQHYDALLVLAAIKRIQEEAQSRDTRDTESSMGKQ